MKLLCIDEDLQFCQLIEKEAAFLGIQPFFDSSIETIRQNGAQQDFSGYIINHELLDDRSLLYSSLDKGNISFVYSHLPIPSELESLKKIGQIHLIAGKPMGTDEAHYLLSKLYRLPNRLEAACDWVDDIPQTLMNDYLKIAYQRLALVSDLIQQTKNPSAHIWEELQNVMHKMAGSAGMYGRTYASEICKKMEIKLKNKDYSDLNLDNFYRQLYLYVQ